MRHWVFGYGSLIYKADFAYLERRCASIEGWQRRFWQGSHDHRGTPEAPGRVVTLIAKPGERCLGMAYLIEESVFKHLDFREKNGYRRFDTRIQFTQRQPQPASATATVYIATADNPAFLGAASAQEMARHIAHAEGPSGHNQEYLLKLALALRQLGARDDHVFELERLLLDYQFSRLSGSKL